MATSKADLYFYELSLKDAKARVKAAKHAVKVQESRVRFYESRIAEVTTSQNSHL